MTTLNIPVDSATEIAIGDAVWLNGSEAEPASSFPWAGDLQLTRAAFAAEFAGIARSASAAGQTAPVAVQIDGQANAAATAILTWDIGNALALADNVLQLSNTTWEPALDAADACARAYSSKDSGIAEGAIGIASALGANSSNVNAQIG